MSKTKLGKKFVSLVLSLAMIFAVGGSAISASAYTHGVVGQTAGLITKALLPVPVRDKSLIVDSAQVAEDVVKAHVAKDAAVAVALTPSGLRKFNFDFLKYKTLLDVKDRNDLKVDKAIILGDATLFNLAGIDGLKEVGLIQLSKDQKKLHRRLRNADAIGALLLKANALTGLRPGAGIIGDSADLLKDNLLIAGGEALHVAGLVLPAHHPLPFVWLPIAVGLGPVGNILLTNQGKHIRNLGLVLAAVDGTGLLLRLGEFQTPILDARFVKNEVKHVIYKDLEKLHKAHLGEDLVAQAFGVGSMVLGADLFAANVGQLKLNGLTAFNLALAEGAVTVKLMHDADNVIWNVLTAAPLAFAGTVLAVRNAVRVPVAATVAAGLGASAAIPATLGTLALASAAAKVAPVALGAAVAAPVAGAAALGAGALGLAGLTAANVAGAAALAAPVVATAVAAPVVGAAALGTAVAGATALGAGALAAGATALGVGALASNLLGGNDSSSSNTTAATPVQTVANAVESVLPSNDQNTQTETQAQETTNTSDASVASTDGPIE